MCVCVLAAAYPYSYTFRLNHFNESGLTTWNYPSLRLHFVPRSSILLYAQGLAASIYIYTFTVIVCSFTHTLIIYEAHTYDCAIFVQLNMRFLLFYIFFIAYIHTYVIYIAYLYKYTMNIYVLRCSYKMLRHHPILKLSTTTTKMVNTDVITDG